MNIENEEQHSGKNQKSKESTSRQLNTGELDSNQILINSEKLFQENINLNIRIKNLEDSLASLNFRYNSIIKNHNFNSHQLSPSDFAKEWEAICKNSLIEYFFDFFDYPYVTFQLVQELLFICNSLIKKMLTNCSETVFQMLKIPSNDSNHKYVNTLFNQLYQEYYDAIFENDSFNAEFLTEFTSQYNKFYTSTFGLFKQEEFYELLNNKSLRLFLNVVKKMILFIWLKSDIVLFDINSYSKRKYEIKEVKESECMLVQGKASHTHNGLVKCVILLDTPMTKNNISYYDLKPWGMEVSDNYTHMQEMKLIQRDSQKKQHISNIDYGIFTEPDDEEKCFCQKMNVISYHKNKNGKSLNHLFSRANGIINNIPIYKRTNTEENSANSDIKPKTYKEIKLFEKKFKQRALVFPDSQSKIMIHDNTNSANKINKASSNGIIRKSVRFNTLINNSNTCIINGSKRDTKPIKIMKSLVNS